MFDQILTDAEVKAIARSRGFPEGSGASRSTVKNLFLASVGVEEALAGLTVEERAALHMLAGLEESVDVSFFERIYHAPDFSFKTAYTQTFNQRYKEVLKTVRERLVRRGILLMDINPFMGGARIEQWNFSLPPNFIERLPPPLQPARLPEPPAAEEVNPQALNGWLQQLLGKPAEGPLAKEPRFRLKLQDGTLWAGSQPLNESHVYEWCGNSWLKSIPARLLSSTQAEHPALAILAAVENLTPEEWFLPRQLTPILAVRCFGIEHPPADAMLEEGWKWGVFARRRHNDQVYYSPRMVRGSANRIVFPPAPDLARYLKANPGARPSVSLDNLPAAVLVALNQTSRLELMDRRLYFSPEQTKIASYYLELKTNPTAQWLFAHLPDYQAHYRQIQASWGKTIIHQNLHLARISDFGLMVQFERAFRPGVDYVRLGEQWVAFHKNLLPEVEKLVKKGEFVIKVVRP